MIKNSILLISLIFILNGCLTKELPSYNTYTLQLKENTTSLEGFSKSIKVTEPKTIQSLNNSAIHYIKGALSKNQYALSKWSDKPSKMIQELITSKLSESGVSFVTSSNIKTKTDYILQSELVNFEQVFIDESSYAILKIRVYLTDTTDDSISFKTFEYKEKCEENNALGAVKSLNTVSNTLANDIQLWMDKVIK